MHFCKVRDNSVKIGNDTKIFGFLSEHIECIPLAEYADSIPLAIIVKMTTANGEHLALSRRHMTMLYYSRSFPILTESLRSLPKSIRPL